MKDSVTLVLVLCYCLGDFQLMLQRQDIQQHCATLKPFHEHFASALLGLPSLDLQRGDIQQSFPQG